MPIYRSSITHMMLVVISMFVLVAFTGCAAAQEQNTLPTETPTNDTQTDTAEAILQEYRQFGGEVAELSASNPSISATVSDVVGTTPAYALTQGNPPCVGYMQSLPSLVFTLATDEPAIYVAFEGNTTTTLVGVVEGEEIVCDETAALTRTPELVVTQPAVGRYGVWIGRTDMQEPINGKLTVSLAP